MVETFDIGDIVEMKKEHPCGNKLFEITRVGADVKIKCCKCERVIMLARSKFVKGAKKIVKKAEES